MKVKAPPKAIRNHGDARYVASFGALSSATMKLTRRVSFTRVQLLGAHIRVTGRVTGAFKPGAAVKITQRVTCTARRVVARETLDRHGVFHADFPTPPAATAAVAVYKARTTVLSGGRPIVTFTLPEPARG